MIVCVCILLVCKLVDGCPVSRLDCMLTGAVDTYTMYATAIFIVLHGSAAVQLRVYAKDAVSSEISTPQIKDVSRKHR